MGFNTVGRPIGDVALAFPVVSALSLTCPKLIEEGQTNQGLVSQVLVPSGLSVVWRSQLRRVLSTLVVILASAVLSVLAVSMATVVWVAFRGLVFVIVPLV